jgi:hypothetical protein
MRCEALSKGTWRRLGRIALRNPGKRDPRRGDISLTSPAAAHKKFKMTQDQILTAVVLFSALVVLWLVLSHSWA